MSIARDILRQATGAFGYEIRKARPARLPAPEGPGFLDGFLEGLLATQGRLSVLQVGANDGVTVDPLHAFLRRHPGAVRAVLVEPLPDIFKTLAANCRDLPGVTPVNAAVGPADEITLWRIKPAYSAAYKGIMASGVTSFDRARVLAKATQLLDLPDVLPEDRIEPVIQRCHTVSALIDTHALGPAPFLQIDVEGLDDEIIYTIDFPRHRPIAINFEAVTLGEAKTARLTAHLEGQGYRLTRWNRHDVLAVPSTTLTDTLSP